jgi:1,4-alpha-glucan branching enzyme
LKNLKKVLSLVVMFLFLASLVPDFQVLASTQDITSPILNSNGTVTFNYQGDGTETKVIVKGSWDSNWTPTNMTDGDNNVWSVTLPFSPGTYEYGICTWSQTTTDQTNGDWKGDPLNVNVHASDGNPQVVVPSTFQSVTVNADKTVNFRFQGDEVTTSISLVGDMNGWNVNSTPMTKDENYNIWTVTTSILTPGKHEYKFSVNGSSSFILDPLNTNKSAGGNSLVYVPGFYNISSVGQVLQNGTATVTAVSLN